ncbi:MAG: EamA family transporter [Alphaproteobacteria bacterium]|nr:EamA family transporter [Alphaproteobacteria bacterium]TAD88537.1 MAG: EamA family transporter [Alphaproteobacteria bacterium]
MTARGSSAAVATGIGAGALLLWGTLALFTTWTAGLPPFQVTAISFTIAGLAAAGTWVVRGLDPRPVLRQPLVVWALGLYGLFGYHACYFAALKLAPPLEANLVNYLWPLLIVLFSATLPGERLRWFHVAGAAIGFAGVVLLVGGGEFRQEHWAGYGLAVGCGVIWSSYSVLSRRFGSVPTDAVGGFCLGAALLAALCHLLFEAWVTPTLGGWVALVLLGLGPAGLAFFAWDIGMKHGHLRLLAAASYGTPLLSTLLLAAFGGGSLTLVVALAAALVVAGSVLASLDVIRR